MLSGLKLWVYMGCGFLGYLNCTLILLHLFSFGWVSVAFSGPNIIRDSRARVDILCCILLLWQPSFTDFSSQWSSCAVVSLGNAPKLTWEYLQWLGEWGWLWAYSAKHYCSITSDFFGSWLGSTTWMQNWTQNCHRQAPTCLFLNQENRNFGRAFHEYIHSLLHDVLVLNKWKTKRSVISTSKVGKHPLPQLVQSCKGVDSFQRSRKLQRTLPL